jgi:hypothetical protein
MKNLLDSLRQEDRKRVCIFGTLYPHKHGAIIPSVGKRHSKTTHIPEKHANSCDRLVSGRHAGKGADSSPPLKLKPPRFMGPSITPAL